MTLSKWAKILYFLSHIALCITDVGVIGLTLYVLIKLTQYKEFLPLLLYVPAAFIIILNLAQFFGFWKGILGIFKEKKDSVLILYASLVINSILDVLIGIWTFTIRDGVHDNVNKIMKDSFKNYTKLHHGKQEWNSIQFELKCCGTEGPQSFSNSGVEFVPIFCCNTTSTVSNNMCETGGFYKDGCINSLAEYANAQLYYFIVLIYLFVIIQIIGSAVFGHLNAVLCKNTKTNTSKTASVVAETLPLNPPTGDSLTSAKLGYKVHRDLQ